MTEATHTTGVDFHCHLDLYPDLEAAEVKTTVTSIAGVLGLSPESVGKAVQSNLRSLLG